MVTKQENLPWCWGRRLACTSGFGISSWSARHCYPGSLWFSPGLWGNSWQPEGGCVWGGWAVLWCRRQWWSKSCRNPRRKPDKWCDLEKVESFQFALLPILLYVRKCENYVRKTLRLHFFTFKLKKDILKRLRLLLRHPLLQAYFLDLFRQ